MQTRLDGDSYEEHHADPYTLDHEDYNTCRNLPPPSGDTAGGEDNAEQQLEDQRQKQLALEPDVLKARRLATGLFATGQDKTIASRTSAAEDGRHTLKADNPTASHFLPN